MTARARRPVGVDPKVVVVDVDLDLVGLRDHEHRGGRGVHATLAFSDGHPLHTMGTGLVLHPGPHGVARQHGGDLTEAAEIAVRCRHDLHAPALPLGERLEHVEEILGEEVGLLATGRTPDLEDHVAAVVGIGRQQQDPQLLLVGGHLGLEPLDLGPHLVTLVALGRRQHLLELDDVVRCAPQPLGHGDDRFELLEPTAEIGKLARVGLDRRVAQADLDVTQLVLEALDPIQHRFEARGPRGTGRPPR